MLHELIAHSPDLKRLKDEGYGIQVRGELLLVHRVPYVNSRREVKFGMLVSELTLSTAYRTAPPSTHVIYFSGEYPCNIDGTPIMPLLYATAEQTLADGIAVQHSFSNKPGRSYLDYYEKIATYVNIIAGPAKALDEQVRVENFMEFPEDLQGSVFQYLDTNSSRANIVSIAEKLKGQKVGIIGVGGSGSYILDFVSKTPVAEIHIYDGDLFHTHNAFRAPGAASIEDLNKQMPKATYFKTRYSNMHKGIVAHPFFITIETVEALAGLNFVFIAIDKGTIKKVIIEYLLQLEIPFVDVGMGIEVKQTALLGMLRVTAGTKAMNKHLAERISFSEDEDDAYNSNIQIAELNALNAALAVIKWKKMAGFYSDLEGEFNTTYTINVSQIVNDEITL